MMQAHIRSASAWLAVLLILAPPAIRLAAGDEGAAGTRPHVEKLASEEMEGRAAGTKGEELAAAYIVRELERIGARPLPGLEDLRVPFTFPAGVDDAGSRVTIRPSVGEAATWDKGEDVKALSFSDSADATGKVVFTGYGLTVPETEGVSWDSYADLDVKDKVVVVLRYFPEDADAKVRSLLSPYAGLRFKAKAAAERGAKALLVVAGPRSPNAGETIPMTFDGVISGSGIVAASIGGRVADVLFAAMPGRTLADVQKELDGGNPHVKGFEIPGVEVTVSVRVIRRDQTARNVIGYLPPRPEAGAASSKPFVLVGAHYDHLGRGQGGNSLAKKEEAGLVHAGADDNASGVAAVLAAAGRLAREDRRRGIILAFWSGEENGLLGSADFMKREDNMIVSSYRHRIAAYVNLDMVGRMRDNKLAVQGVGTSPVWPKLVEKVNVAAGFDVRLQEDPYGPSDITSVVTAGIPSIDLTTGPHEDYHRPTDRPALIDYEDLDRVAAFTAALFRKLADLDAPPEYVKVERKGGMGGRADLRVTTGTIPDFTSEVQGLRLSGVVGGGPAERAGLREGDVIVEFAGRKIANIYDYMYALQAAKPGEPVKVAYTRSGERREVTITPEARK
jgi:hypothetical protein